MRPAVRFACLNLLPWAAYALFNGVMANLYWQVNVITWVICIGLPVLLYGISAAIRQQALRADWLALPGARLAGRVVLVTVLGAALAQLLLHAVLRVIAWQLGLPVGDTAPVQLLTYWINTAIVLGLWCAGWFGAQALGQARRSRQAQREAELRAAQLQHDALRARLNPHFLFNALNNLRALIAIDPARARQQVDDLSLLLRHALDHGDRGAVPLSEELAVVDAYLDMETIHHEERLQVVRQVDASLLSTAVPPMVVQLLVENAIKHGIAVTPGGGELALRIAAGAEGTVQMAVTSPGQIGQSPSGHGVGLAYLDHALTPLGGRYGLEQHDGRVRAWIEVPA
jgi:two-component sensor histidine kinase